MDDNKNSAAIAARSTVFGHPRTRAGFTGGSVRRAMISRESTECFLNKPAFFDMNPLWYKDAIIYQLHVKSFFDGKEDGIGDFSGLRQKLGYLESLGITVIWLLPFYPSPLRDDGYDIADYLDINPHYGTMAEFKAFLDEAHKRGIRVITELVLNHTSDQHEWFQKSRAANPGTYWRDFYVWSDTKDRYREARIIFKDFETSNWTWDPTAKAYFWHRFYSHQPDLNFENPNVHKALFKVIDFWLGMGVDGLRLDAVPYLYEQEGTNCENLPQTFAFLKKLRAHVEAKFPDRMLLAEANQWPEDAAAYFGNGDMCHMAFHFPLMPRMFMALQKEDRFPIIDILEQTPQIPDSAQWAIFLRNHDELTLEMVSEEERDFMYRSYARDVSARINLGIRRRLAPLLQNSRRRIELLNTLLLSLPGTPVIYYGDEIGMGDNHFLGDRDGVRTPMQWSPDRNAGFSKANPQQLFLPVIIDPEYHYQSVNVENEERNLSSLLWWMRRSIAMRRTFQAFSRGSMEIVDSGNASVLSFVRKYGDEAILVVVNLSRYSQVAFLDLGRFAGNTLVDVFSGNSFPRITASPYQMTLGFHDCFWLHLKPAHHADPRTESYVLPDFAAGQSWTDLFDGVAGKKMAAKILPGYLQQRTTAGCRSKKILQTAIVDRVPVKRDAFTAVILFVRVLYADRSEDLIFLPFALGSEAQVNKVIGEDKGLILGTVDKGEGGLIYDCAFNPVFVSILLDLIQNRRALPGLNGKVVGTSELRKNGCAPDEAPSVRLVKAGRRNVCVAISEKLFLKLFRRIDDGNHPDIELHKVLSGNGAELVSGYVGALSYRSESLTCDFGLCTRHFQHSRTLWHAALDTASQFLEETLANVDRSRIAVSGAESAAWPSPTGASSGIWFEKKLQLLGGLTARMHRELAKGTGEAFGVEPFNAHYQRSLYHSLRGLTHRVFFRMEAKLDSLPEASAEELCLLFPRAKEVTSVFMAALKPRLTAVRMRIHGDFHLGQVMLMDEKFRICDFEGSATQSLGERRLKRSPLRDIASMLHSLYCAAHFSLIAKVKIQEKDRQLLLPRAQHWAAVMSGAFIRSYLEAMQDSGLISASVPETKSLLRTYLLERALVDIEKSLDFDQTHLPVAARCFQLYLNDASVGAFEAVPADDKTAGAQK